MTAVDERPAKVREHGTRAKYVVERCRCEPCTTANRTYAQANRRRNLYGRSDLVDPAPAVEHVRRLQAGGMGWRTIARRAGVGNGTVSRLVGYDPRPLQRVHRSTVERLLTVRLELAPGADVDGLGARRRLQALVAIGWSQTRLAARLGWSADNFSTLVHGTGQGRIKHRTAEAVRALYAELWNREPDEPVVGGRDSRVRARNLARARGWAPPLAWDEGSIDDPDARPEAGAVRDRIGHDEPVDPIDLELLLRGKARADQVSVATRRAAVETLTERCLSAAEIGARIGMSQRNVVRLRSGEAS